MIKFIIALTVILTASSASAQTRRSLKDIDKELKQTKSTATTIALIESIGETVPQTDEDVATLGQLMDKYPTQGQKALAKIKDPKRANAIMKECDRQVAKFKADKNKDWKTLPEAQRHEKFNALLNTHAMIATLGNLKNREALPFLKQYIIPEYDGVLSYEASQAIGRIAPDDPAVFKELWEKQGVKSISYNAYGKSVLKEVAEQLNNNQLSDKEKMRILAKSRAELVVAKDPDGKKLLKDLVKNHPDKYMRESAGQALMNSLRSNTTKEDMEYLEEWASNINEGSIGWALYSIRDNWSSRFAPVLLRVMTGSRWGGARGRAAEILGQNKVMESLPYLEVCLEKDSEGGVRGACQDAYWKMTGKIPVIFHPDDVKEIDERYNNPAYIELYAKSKKDDPWTQKRLAIQQALKEFKQANPAHRGRK